MSTAFAAAEARLGTSVLKRLGNASLTLADASVIDGMLRNNGRDASVGIGMAARSVEFECALDQADVLRCDDLVQLSHRGTSAVYAIADRLADDIHLGIAAFVLRQVS